MKIIELMRICAGKNIPFAVERSRSGNGAHVWFCLAAFRNPDFYKAQAMRLPTFDKPRIISLSDETPEYLCLPRGCELDLINLFSAHKVDVKWVDKSYSGKQIDVEFNGQLRDEQEDAVGSI